MKKLSLVLFTMILTLVMGQAQDFNPFVQNASITPKPLLPLEFNGAGELYFDVGNTGVDDLPLVTNQEMTIVITLSNGVPNDVDPINALGGTAVNWFDWSYNAVTKTYTASQNQLIAGSSNGNVTIQYTVDRNTASASPSNGFNVNLQPPPYSNSSNSTLDDADSDYTYTEAIDYGDAPLSYGEAQHYINLVLSNGSYNQYVYLGSEVDQEDSYQDSADATGDDNNGSDDEDGISSFPTMIQGTQVTIPIQLSSEDNSQGFLRAWIDWNADGDFSDANEMVISILPFASSTLYNFDLSIPVDAVPGLTFARLRVGSVSGSSPTGSDSYGEVEDYQLEIIEAAPSLKVIKNQIAAGDAVNELIDYEIVVTNTGNVPISNIDVSDANATITSGNPITSLAPGESASVFAQHLISQDDIDAGYVANTAIATGDSPAGTDDVSDISDTGTDTNGDSITDPETVETPNSLNPLDINGDPTDDPTVTPLTQTPGIALDKSGTLVDGGDGVDVGDVIDYDFTVTNTGNVTLFNVVLSDPDLTVGPSSLTGLSDEDNDGTADDLAVGAFATATGSYTLTQADIDAGTYTNIADVAGDDPNGNEQTDTDDDTQLLPRTPDIVLQKLGTLIDGGDGHDAGDVIDYVFTVTNTGNTTLYNVVLSDPDLTVGPSPLTGLTDEDNDGTADDLAVGALASGTGSYILTQADIDAGSYYNQAVVDADSPNTPVQDDDDDTQQFTQTPSIVLTKTGTLDITVVLPDNRVDVGDVIDYAFTVTNNGNTTLYNVVLNDPDLTVGPSTLTGLTDEDNDGTADDLAVGAIASATGSYTLTQADIDAGTYTNVAEVTGYDPNGNPQTDTDDDTKTLSRSPSIALDKTGTLDMAVVLPNNRADAGDEIDYDFTVTNTGNTTLYNVVLSDPDLTTGPSALTGLTDEDNDGTADDLAVGASATATGTYTLTQDDIDAGSYYNQAVVDADSPTNSVQDDDDDTQTFTRIPELQVTKNETGRSYIVGEYITYDIIVVNTGNVTINNIDVVDANADILSGNPVGTLLPGASATLTAQHQVAQADIDAGFIANTAIATGDSPTGTDDVSDVSDTGTDSDGQTIPNNELVETPNTLNPGAVDGDSTNDPTVTPIAPPDLTPVITASPNVMHGETNFSVFVEVTELNLVNTSTGITVKIPSDIRWSLDGPFDQGLIVLDGIPLNNADWTYQGIISNEHVFTSSAIIPAGGFSMIGFEAIWNGGASQGVYTLTSQILEGSGGENRIDNNVDAEKVDYFIN